MENDGFGQLGVLPGTTTNADPMSAFPLAGDTGIAQGTGTGQHGVTPLIAGGAMGASGAVTSVWHWLNEPFTHPLAPINLFLLVGIVLIAALVWNLILYHIRIAGEAI